MVVLNASGAVGMSTNFIVVWVILVVIAYVLRVYCVSAIQTQSPKLYELLGKPAYISRYCWGFLRTASQHPEFHELTVRARGALIVASALDVIITALSILLVIVALKAALFDH
jgi:hypothetical protein